MFYQDKEFFTLSYVSMCASGDLQCLCDYHVLFSLDFLSRSVKCLVTCAFYVPLKILEKMDKKGSSSI